jgi:hypothetical protein
MRILITGNMGYVGPVVVAHLRQRFPAAEIIGLDSGWFAGCLSTPGPLPETRLDTQHFADVRDVDASLLEGVDAVVHPDRTSVRGCHGRDQPRRQPAAGRVRGGGRCAQFRLRVELQRLRRRGAGGAA